MSLYRPRKRKTDINIVPLIDVMTVLIFFFLMSMRFVDTSTLSIAPPSAETAEKEKSATGMVVAVTKDGAFHFNGRQVEREQLETLLQETGKKTPGEGILIVADEQTLTRDTVYLIDRANKAKLSPKLVTRPTKD